MTDELLPIAENVWLFPHDPDVNKVQPSVGVVCSATQTVLIDAGNSPNHARRVLAAMEKINAPPVSHILFTHHHWDHVFGACVLDARIVAHQLCRNLLRGDAAKPWSRDFIEEELRKNPQRKVSLTAMQNAVGDWDEFRVVVPEDTFADRWVLSLPDVTLEAEYVGGKHAADSSVIRIKEARVMFVGDCFYPAPGERGVNWKMLDRLLSDRSIDTFIHSHGSPIRSAFHVRWAVKVLAIVRR